MVKVLLKHLNIAILSVCLLNISTTAALAQVKTTKGTLQTDSHGNKSREIDYQFDEIQQKSLVSTITMLAGGVVLSRALMVYKPITKDVMAAGVGGAAFFGGEILSNIQIKKELDAVSVKVVKEKDADTQSQLKTFEDLKAGYQKVQKSLKTKKMLQTAAAASFGTAGLLAGYMEFQSKAAVAACKGALIKGAALAKSCAANPATAVATASECTACAVELTGVATLVSKYTISKDLPGNSAAKSNVLRPIQTSFAKPLCPVGAVAAAIGATASGICAKASALELAESSTGAAVSLEVGTNIKDQKIDKIFQSYFEKTLLSQITNLLFPTAQASWMPTIAGISGAILAMFFKTSTMIAKLIDPLMVTPLNRAIVWGIFAGMAFAASKSTDAVIKQIDERIKAIDDIIAGLSKYENGMKTQVGMLASDETGFIKSIGAGVSGIDSQVDYVTPCLDSNSTKNCSSISQKFSTAIDSGHDLPGGLKALTNQVGKLGDNLGGKNNLSAGMLAAADGLGAKNAAIQKALRQQMEKLKKSSSTNPEVQGNELLKKLNNATKNSIKGGGISPSDFLSGMGGSPNAIGTNVRDTGDLLKEDSDPKSLLSSINPEVDLGNKKGDSASDFDFNFQDDGGSMVELGSNNTSDDEIDFDLMSEESIGKSDGPSLFEILTSRYMKSGYPKLLEEDLEENK